MTFGLRTTQTGTAFDQPGGRNARTEVAVCTSKPSLSFWRILLMNFGFLGLQFSFGLQQGNMTPIYGYLGATEAIIPLLYLAGPVTGLFVQPVIGALSDATISRWGRRTPYFLVGAIFCSLSLLVMPFSPALWVAVVLLWILDAANNITQQPYRAYVSDRLNDEQKSVGFIVQSAFTGLGQTLSYLAPSVFVMFGMSKDALASNGIPLITHVAFEVGAVLSISTILLSIFTVRELTLTPSELEFVKRRSMSVAGTAKELWLAFKEMPRPMRRMMPMMLFQWYAMFLYWQYIVVALARSVFATNNPASMGYRDAVLLNGQLGAFYNFIAFIFALLLIRLVRRHDIRRLHSLSLFATALSMFVIPFIHQLPLLFVAITGVGLGWASLMGNPFAMVVASVPAERTGVYMGIMNVFIVVPMLLQTLTVPIIYQSILGGDGRNAIVLAGVLMLCAAGATFLVPGPKAGEAT